MKNGNISVTWGYWKWFDSNIEVILEMVHRGDPCLLAMTDDAICLTPTGSFETNAFKF